MFTFALILILIITVTIAIIDTKKGNKAHTAWKNAFSIVPASIILHAIIMFVALMLIVFLIQGFLWVADNMP